MKVPFFDLAAQLEGIRDQIESSFGRVLGNSTFTMGKEVERFERAFASYCGAPYCVAVNSGTSALHLALLAHGIGEGDEVITQPNSFFATAEAISYTGAKPVFVDVEPDTWGIDAAKIIPALTPRTKAVIPVHLYGNAADLVGINRVVKNRRLIVIEDAAQAHGTLYQGRKIGSFGNTACFSFYPGKVLGAYGEGGAVVTDNPRIAEKLRMLRDHGQKRKHEHIFIGYNYRMEQLQAAFLRVKLKRLNQWIQARRKHAMLYLRLLGDLEQFVRVPREPSSFRSNYYVYAIQCRAREQLVSYLASHGIGSQIHYPTPIHLQKAYRHLGYQKGDFPVAEKLAKETLSLPMYPELAESQIRYVADMIHAFYKNKYV